MPQEDLILGENSQLIKLGDVNCYTVLYTVISIRLLVHRVPCGAISTTFGFEPESFSTATPMKNDFGETGPGQL